MSLTSNASKNIADRLAWHTANRDQAGIAKDLADGKDIPEVYGLGEAGLFDEFFEDIQAFFAFGVEGQTFFAAVKTHEAAADFFSVFIFGKWREMPPRVADFRSFDFNDFRPHIRQNHRAGGAGNKLFHRQDTYTV